MNPLAVELNERLQEKSPFIYRILSQKGRESYFPKTGILSQSMQAKGTDLNATIGIAIEDDLSPVHFRSLERHVKLDPRQVYPYAGCSGLPELRKKWQAMQRKKNPALQDKETSLPVVTCALSHGLSIVSMLFLDPGDTVIIPDLYWGNYTMLIKERLDAKFDIYPFYRDGGMNIPGLRDRLLNTPVGKKVLVMNFPNNPAGYTPTKKEMRNIVETLKEAADKGNEIVVFIDDAYFGLVYEEEVETQSLFAYLAGLHENILAIKIDGATKEDYVWGFRIGFVTYAGKGFDPDVYKVLEDKTAGGIRSSISSSPHLSQSLLLHAYGDPDYAAEKKQKYELMRSRYEEVKNILEKNRDRYCRYFSPLPFNSGYFMCVRLHGDLDGEKVRQLLINEYNTGVIFIHNVLRLAYSAVAKDRIGILFENLYRACKDLSPLKQE